MYHLHRLESTLWFLVACGGGYVPSSLAFLATPSCTLAGREHVRQTNNIPLSNHITNANCDRDYINEEAQLSPSPLSHGQIKFSLAAFTVGPALLLQSLFPLNVEAVESFAPPSSPSYLNAPAATTTTTLLSANDYNPSTIKKQTFTAKYDMGGGTTVNLEIDLPKNFLGGPRSARPDKRFQSQQLVYSAVDFKRFHVLSISATPVRSLLSRASISPAGKITSIEDIAKPEYVARLLIRERDGDVAGLSEPLDTDRSFMAAPPAPGGGKKQVGNNAMGSKLLGVIGSDNEQSTAGGGVADGDRDRDRAGDTASAGDGVASAGAGAKTNSNSPPAIEFRSLSVTQMMQSDAVKEAPRGEASTVRRVSQARSVLVPPAKQVPRPMGVLGALERERAQGGSNRGSLSGSGSGSSDGKAASAAAAPVLPVVEEEEPTLITVWVTAPAEDWEEEGTEAFLMDMLRGVRVSSKVVPLLPNAPVY